MLTHASRSTLLLTEGENEFLDVTFLADASTTGFEVECVLLDQKSAEFAEFTVIASFLDQTKVRCPLPQNIRKGVYSVFLSLSSPKSLYAIRSRNSSPLTVLEGRVEVSAKENAARLLSDGTHEVRLEVESDWGALSSQNAIKHLALR